MKLKRNRFLGNDFGEGNGDNDSIYLESLRNAISNDLEVVTFLHNTRDENIAKKIIETGFEFQSYLDYTTDVVTDKDPVTIKYFTIVRQAYGQYTMVIQIAKQLIEEYSTLLHDSPHHFSELLTTKPPYEGPEEDLIYNLAPHFVKGYVNAESGNFYKNPSFNPQKKIPIFEENMKKIMESK